MENTWKVYADRAAGRGLAWLRKKEAGAVRKNGRIRGLEKKELKTERGSVFYWIEKNAAPGAKCIVCTHGLTANHSMFEKQVEYFRSTCTLITWDVPLHGISRPYRDFSYGHCAQDLNEILEREGIGKAVLVGMSMGGYPSQEFACRYPEKTEGFIALDTTPFGTGYYSKSDIWWLKQAAPMAKWFPEGLLRSSMAKSVSRTAYSRNKMLEMLRPLTKAQIIEQMDIAYGKFLDENKDMRFSCPVLILAGEYDTTGKVKAYCRAWAEKTGYPLHMIADAAHFSNGDNAGQVNAEIEGFIKQL